ncbi:MAG: hypothetical protein ICV54_25415 [Nostoc sp. C3-bin3]|nr:hypothetical protein [Nostoc sp. C3-bin3]
MKLTVIAAGILLTTLDFAATSFKQIKKVFNQVTDILRHKNNPMRAKPLYINEGDAKS